MSASGLCTGGNGIPGWRPFCTAHMEPEKMITVTFVMEKVDSPAG